MHSSSVDTGLGCAALFVLCEILCLIERKGCEILYLHCKNFWCYWILFTQVVIQNILHGLRTTHYILIEIDLTEWCIVYIKLSSKLRDFVIYITPYHALLSLNGIFYTQQQLWCNTKRVWVQKSILVNIIWFEWCIKNTVAISCQIKSGNQSKAKEVLQQAKCNWQGSSISTKMRLTTVNITKRALGLRLNKC